MIHFFYTKLAHMQNETAVGLLQTWLQRLQSNYNCVILYIAAEY